MSKVLVDLEEIEAVRNTLANGGGAVGVLRWAESVLAAQPAEAEGPSFAEVLEQASVIQQLGAKNKRIDELQAALSAVTAERDGEAESCEQWRNLALQFDRHRMSALAHLKMVVAGQDGALDACRGFLSAPPVPGHAITEEIDQLRAEVEALRKAFMRMRNVAAGYSNYCEFDSANTRRLEREFEATDELFRSSAAMTAKEA